MRCYQCEKETAYLFDDARCKDCTRLTPEEVRGDALWTEEDEQRSDIIGQNGNEGLHYE